MHKNVGKEIQMWTKVLVVILTISAVLIGILAFFLLGSINQEGLGVLAMIVISVIGYLVARLLCILLYGYGEMIKCLTSIDKKLNNRPWPDPFQEEAVTSAPVPSPPPVRDVPVTYRNPDGTWNCIWCDCRNSADAVFCQHCAREANLQ